MKTVKEREPMIARQNLISVDRQTARDSYGNFFTVGEVVGHDEGESAGIAEILSFEPIEDRNEIRVHTTRGYCHLDFCVKLEK